MRIETERVALAPFSFRDVSIWFALARDPQVRAHLGGVMSIVPRVRTFARDLRLSRRGYLWCVRENGRRIGLMYLTPTRETATMELSYLFRLAVWGRGLASDSVSALLLHAKQTAPEIRIVAETQAANLRSRRLLERQGFVETGRLTRFGTEQICFEWTEGA